MVSPNWILAHFSWTFLQEHIFSVGKFFSPNAGGCKKTGERWKKTFLNFIQKFFFWWCKLASRCRRCLCCRCCRLNCFCSSRHFMRVPEKLCARYPLFPGLEGVTRMRVEENLSRPKTKMGLKKFFWKLFHPRAKYWRERRCFIQKNDVFLKPISSIDKSAGDRFTEAKNIQEKQNETWINLL